MHAVYLCIIIVLATCEARRLYPRNADEQGTHSKACELKKVAAKLRSFLAKLNSQIAADSKGIKEEVLAPLDEAAEETTSEQPAEENININIKAGHAEEAERESEHNGGGEANERHKDNDADSALGGDDQHEKDADVTFKHGHDTMEINLEEECARRDQAKHRGTRRSEPNDHDQKRKRTNRHNKRHSRDRK